MRRTLGADAVLPKTLHECVGYYSFERSTHSVFQNYGYGLPGLLRYHGGARSLSTSANPCVLHAKVSAVVPYEAHYYATQDFDDTDVTPPPPILDHVQTLRDIMTVYGSSLGDDDVDADQDAGFQKALDATIDPALEMCVAAAEEKKRVRPTWDAAVFVINCLTYLQVSFGAGM